MRFEPVLGKLWRNLDRSPKFCKFCENLEIFEFEAGQRYINLVDLENILMLKNASTLAIGGLDTAENEPPKVHKSSKELSI